MIELKDIKKSYRMGEHEVLALNGVNLTVEAGDFVAIMGPSGSGKSTLAHIMGLLDVPTSGSYQLHGSEVSQLTEDELAVLRRGEVGFIFQQFNLLPRMNASENVALPMLYSRLQMDLNESNALLARVGLADRSGHRPNELSGGQQQRVAIARSLTNKPRILIADEPTGNLDSKSEVEIMGILNELNSQGITIILVTHEEEIGLQAKRLIRMRDGVVQSDERYRPVQTAGSPRGEMQRLADPGFRWAEVLEHFRQGFKTLTANKVRSGLSMLGILIGVAAVVAMLALGTGAQQAIEHQLASLGSNLLILRSGSSRRGGVSQDSGTIIKLTPDDAEEIRRDIPTIKSVSADVSGRVQAAYANKNWNTQVTGASPSYAEIHASVPTVGRFFTAAENQRRDRVAVVGATIVKELFGDENPIGAEIKINRISFQVIGILPVKGSTGWRDQDDIILVPVQTAMHRLLGKDQVDSFDLEVDDAKHIDQAQTDVLNLMYSRKRVPESQREDAFIVRNMADIQDALTSSSRTMSMLLAVIAAISLVVGGIGIMNIMLVSVTERTKEIGLRKAIGAKRRDILLQFLAEAVVVSAVGGLTGIFLGWLVTVTLSALAGWATAVSLEAALLAFGFSAFIGVVFGIYPARQASMLHPIEALRYE